MDLVQTRFVFVLQHDFRFCREVDYTNLVKSIEGYSSMIRCVKFNNKPINRGPPCTAYNESGTTPVDTVNGLNFYLTFKWGDG